MKKNAIFLSAILLIAMSTVSFAQSFRVKAGLNFSDVIAKDDLGDYSNDTKMKVGFHAGASYEIPVNHIFSVETSLLLSTKGYKYSETGTNYEYNGTQSLIYFDLPVTAKASFIIGENKMYGALGPYFGIGISGKTKYEDTYLGTTDSGTEVINWGSGEEDDLKQLDFGLALGVGYELESIQIELFYNIGLVNIVPNPVDGLIMNHRVLSISLGYRFGGKYVGQKLK